MKTKDEARKRFEEVLAKIRPLLEDAFNCMNVYIDALNSIIIKGADDAKLHDLLRTASELKYKAVKKFTEAGQKAVKDFNEKTDFTDFIEALDQVEKLVDQAKAKLDEAKAEAQKMKSDK